MGHEIKYMIAERIKCACDWMFNLDNRELWGKPKGNDIMLDAYAMHKASMKQVSERVE